MSTAAPAGEKQLFLDRIYGRIARRYDVLNFVQSLGWDAAIRRGAARHLDRGVILDVGAGSGALARAALRAGAAKVICLDRNAPMFGVARRKLAAEERAGRVRFVYGDLRRLPFRAASFDGVGSAFVYRNLPADPATDGELARVVKPGGALAVADVFAPPRGWWGTLARWYINAIVPWLGALITGYAPAHAYFAASVRACFSARDFAARLGAAGFGAVTEEPYLGGVAYVVAARAASCGK
jgi:ubiquinone/menaquinone biosynthesis methyltransferase